MCPDLGGQGLQAVGQLVAKIAAGTGDLLLEDQFEGFQMRLGDLDAVVAEVAAGGRQPAQGMGDASDQGITEAAAWTFMTCTRPWDSSRWARRRARSFLAASSAA